MVSNVTETNARCRNRFSFQIWLKRNTGLKRELNQLMGEQNQTNDAGIVSGIVHTENSEIEITLRDGARYHMEGLDESWRCLVSGEHGKMSECRLYNNKFYYSLRVLDIRDLLNMVEKIVFPFTSLAHLHPLKMLHCSSLFPAYKMSRLVRGICMIINNAEYESQSNLERRDGSEEDVNNLTDTFELFGRLEVHVFDDLTDSGIIEEIERMSRQDHSEYDCFVGCILAHGDTGIIKGVNGKDVTLQQVTSAFRRHNCPSLANKPKLFFIQSCQGAAEQQFQSVYRSDVIVDNSSPVHSSAEETDFFIACSTVPGFVSYRHPENGSLFIDSLCDNLKKCCHHDIHDVMTRVCCENSNRNDCYKQVPCFTSTLTKRFVLNPLYVNDN